MVAPPYEMLSGQIKVFAHPRERLIAMLELKKSTKEPLTIHDDGANQSHHMLWPKKGLATCHSPPLQQELRIRISLRERGIAPSKCKS